MEEEYLVIVIFTNLFAGGLCVSKKKKIVEQDFKQPLYPLIAC